MDSFNRPPAIAEDTVLYSIYPAPGEDKAAVTSLSTLIAAHVRETLLPPNHIWHRDAFDLHVIDATTQSPYIEGTIRVGDCVDDEWCTVWLLSEISRKFDVVLSVYDSDGEFLLIEAAECLPRWVTPENAENRVWIYKSHLHIIPLEHVSPPSATKSRSRRKLPRHGDSDGEDDDSESSISIEAALQLVRSPETRTIADQAVQAAIQRKIGRYPDALRQHVHTTKAYLPSDIVLILSQNPSLVQKAVEAFYTRDALQLRAVSKMSRFPPRTSVYAGVSMTRTALAQLMGQRFHPPKIFGRWLEQEGSPEWQWKDIGMKVACGFEMLYAENKSRPAAGLLSSTLESRDALKDALRRDTAYQTYIGNLKRAGFFPTGEVEGSQKWQDREAQAATMWVEVRKNENLNRPSFTALVDEALSLAQRQKDAILADTTPTIREDPTDWLNISPDDLEKTLAGAGGLNGTAMEVDLPESGIRGDDADEDDAQTHRQTEKLGKLAEKVGKFVEGKGDLNGVRFEDDLLSDDDEDFELSDTPISESEAEEDFGTARSRRQKLLDSLVAPLDPSDYGKIPPIEEKPLDATQKTMSVTIETETRTLPTGEARKIRQPILMRDRFDGVDSDDEEDEEDEGDDAQWALDSLREGDESDDETPQVVGGISHDIDINMDEEEEEFLKFSREALGISDGMWTDIVNERRGRGAFVPGGSHLSAGEEAPNPAGLSSTTEAKMKNKTNKFFNAISGPPPKLDSISHSQHIEAPPSSDDVSRVRNPDLDSFEAVMEAMEIELQKSRQSRKDAKTTPQSSKTRSATSHKQKGKGKAAEVDDVKFADDPADDDDDKAMDAELRAALRRDNDEEDNDGEVEEAGIDYNLIKNFLESFRSQGGLSGPVGNLAGRLEPGWKLPRDEAQ